MMIADFISLILRLKLRYSFSVVSWLRSEKRNKAVGGHPFSWHMMGLAVDVVLDNEADKTSFLADCKRFGLVVVDEKDHLHVQVDGKEFNFQTMEV